MSRSPLSTALPLLEGRILFVDHASEARRETIQCLKSEGHQVTLCKELPTLFTRLSHTDQPSGRGYDVIVFHTDTLGHYDLQGFVYNVRYFNDAIQLIELRSSSTEGDRLHGLGRQPFFLGGIESLADSCEPALVRRAVRLALELKTIYTRNHELRLHHRLNEILKQISCCEDQASLHRLTPMLISWLLVQRNGSSTEGLRSALFALHTEPGAKQSHFRPLFASGYDRLEHGRIGEFLSWLYEQRWRLFNRCTILRGNYPPWDVKNSFGKHLMLLPVRHLQGLWGALLVGSEQARLFTRQLRETADLVGHHLARTYAIIDHERNQARSDTIDQSSLLYTEEYLHRYGDLELHRATIAKQPACLLQINIESFRKINDQHGHLVGGQFIRHIGGIIRSLLRETDIAARIQADHFVILLMNCGPNEADTVVKRLNARLQETPFTLAEGKRLDIVAQTAIRLFPDHGRTMSELLDFELRQQVNG